jgi:hypothetical protein
MLRFTKIKYDGKAVLLATVEKKGLTEDVRTITSKEDPHPEFVAALARCLSPALEVRELEHFLMDDPRETRVQSVTMNEDDQGNRGAVVTMLRSLHDRDVPLVLNTPHMKSDAMPGRLAAALELLECEARDFLLKGKRAQSDLFASVTVESPEPAGV